MFAVEVKVEEHLTEKMRKVIQKNPAARVSRLLAQELVWTLKGRAPFWHGTLMRSIQSHPTKEGYNIHMVDYAEGLEFGHGPVEVNPLIIAWAFEKSRAPFKAIETLITVGAIKHPFVQSTINSVMAEFDKYSFEVKNVLKESGFR